MAQVVNIGSKVCGDCGVVLTAENKVSRYNRCKPCKNRRVRENPEGKIRYALQKKYGITLEEYDDILMAQDFSCGSCGIHHTGDIGGQRLAVDHDHYTGEIRGLLCMQCNTALGKLGDNLDGVMNLVKYLKGGDHG